MTKLKPRSRSKGAIIVIVGGAIVLFSLLGIFEIALRHFFPTPSGYFIYRPNDRTRVRLPNKIWQGISSAAVHTTNPEGVRGEPVRPGLQYRILTVGGSTTACNALGDNLSWPFRLQELLRQQSSNKNLWVGNIGKDALNTRHHLVTLEKFLPNRPKIDLVVLLVGANDFTGTLSMDSNFHPMTVKEIENDEKIMLQAFQITPKEAHLEKWYKYFALWQITKLAKEGLIDLLSPSPEQRLVKIQEIKQRSKMRPTIPDLTLAKQEYRKNLEELILLGRKFGVRMIFMTQPSLYAKKFLTDAETKALLFGYVGKPPDIKEYYSPNAISEGLEKYNTITKEVCRENSIECVDLAQQLSPDLGTFYDDYHFTILGAERVAGLLANYLLATTNPLFSQTDKI